MSKLIVAIFVAAVIAASIAAFAGNSINEQELHESHHGNSRMMGMMSMMGGDLEEMHEQCESQMTEEAHEQCEAMMKSGGCSMMS